MVLDGFGRGWKGLGGLGGVGRGGEGCGRVGRSGEWCWGGFIVVIHGFSLFFIVFYWL